MTNVLVQVLKIVESQNVPPLELLIIILHNQMSKEAPDKNPTQILKQKLQLQLTLVVLKYQPPNSAAMLLSTKNLNFQEALLLTSAILSQVVKVKASAQMVASLLLNNILLYQNLVMIVMDISIVFVKKREKMLIQLISVVMNIDFN